MEETKEWVSATESIDWLKKCSAQLEMQMGHLQCGVGGRRDTDPFVFVFGFDGV